MLKDQHTKHFSKIDLFSCVSLLNTPLCARLAARRLRHYASGRMLIGLPLGAHRRLTSRAITGLGGSGQLRVSGVHAGW